MTTRADRFTQLQKVPDLFSDFLTDMTPHPVTKDLIRNRNDQAVRQSIRNLVLTNYNERPFQPGIGSSVGSALFELVDDFLENDIEDSIRRTITSNEPRASLMDVRAELAPDENSVSINILFSVINSTQPQSLEIVLRRVR